MKKNLIMINLLIGGLIIMAHTKVYAFCENMCREETMTKEQIEDYVDGQTSSYVNGQFAVLGGSFKITNLNDDNTITINYPEGFNQSNSVPISFGTGGQSASFGYAGLNYASSPNNNQKAVMNGGFGKILVLNESNIILGVNVGSTPDCTNLTINYKLVLMKHPTAG